MSPFEMPEFDAHERVIFGHDAASGLRAMVAIHSTALGPGAGGCRMWAYASTDDAVRDVLRLSRGMSYKNAMANLRFGGGKAVIIGNAQRDKTPALFEAFGKLIDSIGGRYVTAEDVGTTTADMEIVSRQTRFVCGRAPRPGQAGGDPSPKTALGVYLGIKAAVKFRLGRSDLSGVENRGPGRWRGRLPPVPVARRRRCTAVGGGCAAGGGGTSTRRVQGHACCPADAVLSQDVDVIAPCALGAILDSRSIGRLQGQDRRGRRQQPVGGGPPRRSAAKGGNPVCAGLCHQCGRHNQRLARVLRRLDRSEDRRGHSGHPGAAGRDLRAGPPGVAANQHDRRPDGARSHPQCFPATALRSYAPRWRAWRRPAHGA